MMKYLLVSISILFVFTACSSKKYFEPENTSDDLEVVEKDMSSIIKSMNRSGATLEDGEVLTKNGISKSKLPDNFEFINISDKNEIIATNNKDAILIGETKITTKGVVIAASSKDNKLALIYSDNSIQLLDLTTKNTIFKDYSTVSLVNDTRIVNPYFMGNLILFPTLDGKIMVVSNLSNELVKTISVDPDGDFNNIIFLDVLKGSDTLITATANKIVSISAKSTIAKDYEIRDIIVNKENIYIATIDGQIMKLNSQLNPVSKNKYKYSKIYALAFTDSLYAVESQGFIIKINEDFSKDVIYEFDFNNEKRLIIIDNNIYYDYSYITLP